MIDLLGLRDCGFERGLIDRNGDWLDHQRVDRVVQRRHLLVDLLLRGVRVIVHGLGGGDGGLQRVDGFLGVQIGLLRVGPGGFDHGGESGFVHCVHLDQRGDRGAQVLGGGVDVALRGIGVVERVLGLGERRLQRLPRVCGVVRFLQFLGGVYCLLQGGFVDWDARSVGGVGRAHGGGHGRQIQRFDALEVRVGARTGVGAGLREPGRTKSIERVFRLVGFGDAVACGSVHVGHGHTVFGADLGLHVVQLLLDCGVAGVQFRHGHEDDLCSGPLGDDRVERGSQCGFVGSHVRLAVLDDFGVVRAAVENHHVGLGGVGLAELPLDPVVTVGLYDGGSVDGPALDVHAFLAGREGREAGAGELVSGDDRITEGICGLALERQVELVAGHGSADLQIVDRLDAGAPVVRHVDVAHGCRAGADFRGSGKYGVSAVSGGDRPRDLLVGEVGFHGHAVVLGRIGGNLVGPLRLTCRELRGGDSRYGVIRVGG